MNITLEVCKSPETGVPNLSFIDSKDELASRIFSSPLASIEEDLDRNAISFSFEKETKSYLVLKKIDKDLNYQKELNRKLGSTFYASIKGNGYSALNLSFNSLDESAIAFIEGLYLTAYSFKNYKTDRKDINLTINIVSDSNISSQIDELTNVLEAVNFARDLVNKPFNKLGVKEFTEEIFSVCKDTPIEVEILGRKEIEELKMGGLLAVNQASATDPAFAILKYNPQNVTKTSPIVFVGKGVVYDTGGLSLKPTPNSMDIMKCDIGGAATALSCIVAAAKNNLPVNLICLLPLTDNSISNTAYAPGDVITMFDGTTVEVLNTDAEGRLTLADALSYAKRFEPELVIDFATLTGAALRAIGHEGSVFMGNAPTLTKQKIIAASESSYERLVEFPLWKEYSEQIKSSIADLKNLGGPEAGAITAGKFLEHFVDYNWLHFDIAGTAFLPRADYYKTEGGTGTAVRTMFEFLKSNYTNEY